MRTELEHDWTIPARRQRGAVENHHKHGARRAVWIARGDNILSFELFFKRGGRHD